MQMASQQCAGRLQRRNEPGCVFFYVINLVDILGDALSGLPDPPRAKRDRETELTIGFLLCAPSVPVQCVDRLKARTNI